MKLIITILLFFLILILINSPTLFPEPTSEQKIAAYISDGSLTKKELVQLGVKEDVQINPIRMGEIDLYLKEKKAAEKKAATEKVVAELRQNWYTTPFAWLLENILSMIYTMVVLCVLMFSLFILSRMFRDRF